MGYRLLLVIFFVFKVGLVLGQNSGQGRLLEQAEEKLHQDPKEAKLIAEYNLKLSEKDLEKTKSYYLQSLSFYIMGQYSETLEAAFAGKELAEKVGNQPFENKFNQLIDRTFKGMLLEVPKKGAGIEIEVDEAFFRAEDAYLRAEIWMMRDELDSMNHYLKKANDEFQAGSQTWLTVYKLTLKGDIFFKQLKMDSALIQYQIALTIAEGINNPFFKQKLHQKIAKNYLAMDSISGFQNHTLRAQELDLLTTKQENEASNTAYRLVSSKLDQSFIQMNYRFRLTLWILLGLFVSAILIKMIFYFRNQNKLKMYRKFLDYLQRSNHPPVQNEELNEEEKKDNGKTNTILKESENQILSGLEKFESSTKFTNKDMSLGMLAAQMNTNTKYLSEVINRQKQKNFNAYINELRINYITDKMRTDPNYLNFKVSYLAEECGFSSHSTFTTVFKSIVGLSPIMFIDFVKEEMKTETTMV